LELRTTFSCPQYFVDLAQLYGIALATWVVVVQTRRISGLFNTQNKNGMTGVSLKADKSVQHSEVYID
jgi:hypothetical protein